MQFNYYGHNGVPAQKIPQRDGYELVRAYLMHDFIPADRDRHIHEIKVVYHIYHNGRQVEGSEIHSWLNEYMADKDAHEMARQIYHNRQDPVTGANHQVRKWPGRAA